MSAIEQLKKNQKGSDDNAILDYLQKRGNDINQQALALGIVSLSKNGIILHKPSSGKSSYTVNPKTTKQIANTVSSGKS